MRLSLSLVTAAICLLAPTSVLAQRGTDGNASNFTYPIALGNGIPPPRNVSYPGPMSLKIDATDNLRGIFSVEQTIPVNGSGGHMVMLFPEWLPGTHGPRGELDKVVDLKFFANGNQLMWVRDALDTYAFHITVPAGARNVLATFKFASATEPDQGRVVMTPSMLNLQPNSVSLYPAGYFVRRIEVDMTVKYPSNWTQACALKATKQGDSYVYERTTYDVLVDSPVFAGLYHRRDQLTDTVAANWFADDAKYLNAKPEHIALHRKLAQEAKATYGIEHFDRYEFLVALTSQLGGIGLEHHRSSENSVTPRFFLDFGLNPRDNQLLPHEFSHSWAGKYRRPAGLTTPDFRTPMQDNLLWAYEGTDQFFGYVIGARSGLYSKQQTLDAYASIVASLATRKGRTWRTLEDTTHDPIISNRRPKGWTSMQRSEDYYNEGLVFWMEVDSIIRKQTNGMKSIDDWARIFYNGIPGDYNVNPFVINDVVAALRRVVPGYDWRSLITNRIINLTPELNVDGFVNNGYQLVYNNNQSAYLKATEGTGLDLIYSLGMSIDSTGKVTGVLWDSLAFKHGMSIGTVIVGVNGRAYSKDYMKDVITQAATTNEVIELTVRKFDRLRTERISYTQGLRYPSLQKIGQGVSGLDRLLSPLTGGVNSTDTI